MGMRLFLIWPMLECVTAFACAQAPAKDWEKVMESDGIVGYVRALPGTGVNQVKAIGKVNASIAVIEAVLRDDAARPTYMYRCCEGFRINTPNLKNTKDTYYSYHKIDMPWPLYDRDVVARIEVRADEASGALLFNIQSVSSDFRMDCPDTMRAPLTKASWVLTPIEAGKTEVVYEILADPGGYIPVFIVNMFSNHMGVSTIAGLKHMVQMDKYRNAQSVITTTPWHR